eukprot:GFUD01129691.1.p1 GENE.GFUD01129691.1~~GFUD01129691.1.p1  ORF type:complete len:448 (-),score=102.64 GFUD01129691.1:27-1238(-)
MDSDGNIKQVVDTENDDQFPSFFGKPFQQMGGSQNKWNPFRKKSGLMAVMHAQTKKNRVVSKHGRINTFSRSEEAHESHRLLKDFFTSLIDLSWSWTLFSFAASFYISWLLFAVVWYLVVYTHGDLDVDKPENHTVCVDNIVDFTSCFLYSLETQHTIGYGGRAVTEQCPVAIIVMSFQSIVGVVIQACMAGIVFAKFTKPTGRAETLMFSKNALITLRNGAFYLVVRLADLRPTHLIECHVSGHFMAEEATDEGETNPYHLASMSFGSELDGTVDYIQPFWPLVVSHKIDDSSPLYQMSPRDFQSKQFEIIVTLEGVTPETGCSVQVRTSYLPSEILWGQRFEHTTVAYDKDMAKYAVSYRTLNNFVQDRTPRCSAKDFEERSGRKSTNISKSPSSNSLLTP